LKWRRDDIGPPTQDGSSLRSLALSAGVLDAVKEARRWKRSEDWYRAHGLPWRRGWLLVGRPGTGKTALLRAVAEDLDLPVFVFDLASMDNAELHAAWQKVLYCVPCMAVMEDLDAVFAGRKNRVGDLTFDALLSCMDGVQRADGVFLAITTNNPEKLDPAIGVAAGAGDQSTRPGRIDRVLQMTVLDEAGRRQLAARILSCWPEHREAAVSAGAGETGAQFQERCGRLALQLYWGRGGPELLDNREFVGSSENLGCAAVVTDSGGALCYTQSAVAESLSRREGVANVDNVETMDGQ